VGHEALALHVDGRIGLGGEEGAVRRLLLLLASGGGAEARVLLKVARAVQTVAHALLADAVVVHWASLGQLDAHALGAARVRLAHGTLLAQLAGEARGALAAELEEGKVNAGGTVLARARRASLGRLEGVLAVERVQVEDEAVGTAEDVGRGRLVAYNELSGLGRVRQALLDRATVTEVVWDWRDWCGRVLTKAAAERELCRGDGLRGFWRWSL